MPLRLLALLKEPGEASNLTLAIIAALISGGTGLRLFQGEGGNVAAGIAQGVFTLAAVFIVYYFRDRMKRTEKGVEIHKTDTTAQLDFVKIVQDLTNNLNAANSERLREQRDSYRVTIATINNRHSVELANERTIKHHLIQILTSSALSSTIIYDRIKHGLCTIEELYDEPRHLPAHVLRQIEGMQVVPEPTLEPICDDTHDDTHTTP